MLKRRRLPSSAPRGPSSAPRRLTPRGCTEKRGRCFAGSAKRAKAEGRSRACTGCSFRSSLIKPAAPFEPQERDEGAQSDDGKRDGVAPRPIKLRHELEIHSVNPDYYCRRYADNRYDREHLEQIVLLDADKSENGIQKELNLVGKLSLVVVQ